MAVSPASALLVLGQAAATVQAVVDQLRRIPDSVRGFVDSFNPQAGLNLDRAFSSLSATIGYAMEPVILSATVIVDSFAGALSEGMDRLRRPVEAVTGALTGALRPAIETVGTVMDALASAADMLLPLLQPLGTVVEGIASVMRILLTITAEYYLALLQSLVPGTEDLTKITEWLTAAFVKLAETTLRLADFMLAVVGREKLLRPILEALIKEPRRDGRTPAPAGFNIGGLEDIYRRRLLEAAKGAGKPVEERTFDVMSQIRDLAKGMLDELKNRPAEREAARQAQGDFWLRNNPVINPAGFAIVIAEIFRQIRQNDRNRP